ncbi:MAG: YoaK family protein [Nodosilinea sp.]
MVATSPPKSSFSLGSYFLSDGPAGFMLSWVAGFVDTSAFIILFGIFTAHVTGNIALAGYEFVNADEESTITHLLMFPVFMLAVAATSLLARYARSKQWPVFAVLLTAEALALVVFLIVGVSLSPSLIFDVQEEYILPIGMAGVVAMAIQNALMKEAKGVFKSYIPTTVMTGNTTQLTIDLVQVALSKFSSDDEKAALAAAESMERMGRVVPIILGFALGGLGATYFVLVSETWWSLVIPAVVVSFMAIVAFSEHAKAFNGES